MLGGRSYAVEGFLYDGREDKYNLLSALQKSIRGSDPDAAVHYLARLVEGGADPQTIGRRLLVIASEDVGMVFFLRRSALSQPVSRPLLMTGFPEARINLAQAVILLSSSPKSNSCITAIDSAIGDLRGRKTDDVPRHLMDSHYQGSGETGVWAAINILTITAVMWISSIFRTICTGKESGIIILQRTERRIFQALLEGLRGPKENRRR